MAAKQRGGGSKKRLSQRQPSLDIRFHAQPPPSLGGPLNGNAPISLTTSPEVTAANDNYMQTRREFVFASLVGHRISVTTRDGSIISGVFTLHGNSLLLPGAWRSLPQDPRESSPSPETTFVYTPARSVPVEPEDDGWRVVRQKRRSTTRSKPETIEDTNSSVSSNSEAPPVFELLYAEHRAAKSKQSYLWLRCAYRTATGTQRSSRVMDWLAIPWDEVAYVAAADVPDNPDELGSSRPRLGFQTDAEITGNARSQPERQLQRWADQEGGDGLGDTSWPATIVEGTEEGPGTWDQFTVNEHKFGVKSTYVDGMYSTTLNEDVIPQEYIKHADRLAEEMDAQRKSRVRGDGRYQYRSDESADETEDEEARFSAVAGTGRYANPKLLTRSSRPQIAQDSSSMYSRRSIGRGRHDHHQVPPSQRPPQQRTDLPKRQCSSHASNSSIQPPPPNKHHDPAPPNHSGQNLVENQDNAIRNVKDNINALNLEPIKSRKLSQRKEGAWVLPTTASAGQQAADLQEKRAQKKAEFLRSLRLIESNLAKKGWDATKPPSGAENATTYRTPDTTATPPLPRKQLIGERPSSAAVPECRMMHPPPPPPAAAPDSTGMQAQWPAPVQQGSSGTGDGLASEDVSSTAEESLMEKRLFQFNPNATTFTPKGNSSEAEHTVPPPPPPEAAKPVLTEQPTRPPQTGSAVPAVKRNNIAFKPFDLVVADYRRRGKHSWDEAANVDDASEMSMVSHFYDIFVEAAREGVASQAPSQQAPDWENKLAISYTDLLQPTSMMAAIPAPPAAAAPAFFAPSAPQTPQAIFFPSGGATLNPAAPPFTHVTQPHFFNVPIMRPAIMTQAGMAEPPPGTMQPAGGYHQILLPQQRWQMTGQPEGQPWQVLQAAPGAYGPDLYAAYSLVCPRVPYQMPR